MIFTRTRSSRLPRWSLMWWRQDGLPSRWAAVARHRADLIRLAAAHVTEEEQEGAAEALEEWETSELAAAAAAVAQVSRSCACIGSPCLRHCGHGASIGGGGGGGAGADGAGGADAGVGAHARCPGAGLRGAGAAGEGAVSRPFPSWNRSMLTEIYLCHACSCQEILRTETAGQGAGATPGAARVHPHGDASRA
jgi:hypothetical protein